MVNEDKKDILDQFLEDETTQSTKKISLNDRSIVERIEKKIIVEDGRQLLM